jgi:hypothetical protein
VSADAYLDALSAELTTAGVRGRARGRILAEFADHLSCDPAAQLGAPAELAHEFADELGTARARRSAAATFLALALAGVLSVGAFLFASFGPLRTADSRPLAVLAGALLAIAGQVAFATGVLAGLRAFRRRLTPALPRAEATVIVRRTVIALSSGIVTMAALALLALAIGHAESSGWRIYALVAAGIGAIALLAVSPAVLAAARLRPTAPGDRGDIFDDLGPLAPAPLRGRPWRLALTVAAMLLLAAALQGVATSDPYDGVLRGLLEALACLTGFGLLGPYVGLWQPARAGQSG